MKKILSTIIACIVVAGCTKESPQPTLPNIDIDWAPDATAAQRQSIRKMAEDLVQVEGGTYYMGVQHTFPSSPGFDSTTWYEQTPVHLVTLSAFKIGRYEISRKQWYDIMGDGTGMDGHYTIETADLPIEGMMRVEVDTFLARIEHLSGLCFRLPTESEWEYAARGGADRPEGNRFSGAYYSDEVAWNYYNSGGQLHPVGQLKANNLGLYDMSGNVAELCSDIYAPYPAETHFDPQGPSHWENDLMAVRGGHYMSNDQHCRVYYRSYASADYPMTYVGLRLVYIPKKEHHSTTK